MAALSADVVHVSSILQNLRARIQLEQPDGINVGRIGESIQKLLTVFGQEFDVGGPRARNPSEKPVAKSRRQLQQSVPYLKRKTTEMEDRHDDEIGRKHGARITAMWFARVSLASPTVPARVLESWCRDFPSEETTNIGRAYVSNARNAMCELVKRMNRL